MQIQSNRAFTPVQQANSRPSANQGTVDHCADPNWREWSEGLNALSTGWQNFGGLDPNQHTRVAVLDDFNSAHGFEMESALNRNGADTLRLNVNRQGQSRTAGIAASLEEVAARLDRGEDIDAVSLSQQDFQGSPESGRIGQLISYIQQRHGVPVVVAAGNGGNGSNNTLAQGAALVAENATPGTDVRSPNSSAGNILQEANTTSLATALVAARAGQLRNSGVGLAFIVAGLRQQAAREGGALN